VEYQRHKPQNTLLHQVIRGNLETFLANARERGAPVARFVVRELRDYLNCGVLAEGFLRVHCDACGYDRLVAFSCKGRGFCPSCAGRRMADTAAHLVERVLPEVPVRQWVLTIPYPLRYRCAWDARLTSEVLRAFMRALFADLRRRARRHHGVPRGHCGSVTFIQRFGSALNLTPHFHSLVLDGVYAGPAYNPGRFIPLPPPETEDVARVMAGTARRVMRLLKNREFENGDATLATDDPLLAMLMAASIRSRIATGPEAGRPWRRLGDRVDPVESGETGVEAISGAPPRCVRQGGMSLHADVAVPARDRRRLERLCRYMARPPLAVDRLEAVGDGRLAYRLKTRWRDGTTHVLMERYELLERLAPLIPPPRAHQVRYHGVLAPCASGRDHVVPSPAKTGAMAVALAESERSEGTSAARSGVGKNETLGAESTPRSSRAAVGEASAAGEESGTVGWQARQGSSAVERSEPIGAWPAPPPRRHPWAELLQRVFEVDALRCPRCGEQMRILSAITDSSLARRVLKCLGLPPRAPPLAPAAPPEFAVSSWFDDRRLMISIRRCRASGAMVGERTRETA
jgi:hypothetical protein